MPTYEHQQLPMPSSGLKKCEFVSHNPDVFGEVDFAPWEVTNNAIIAVSKNMKCDSVNVETSSTSGIN